MYSGRYGNENRCRRSHKIRAGVIGNKRRWCVWSVFITAVSFSQRRCPTVFRPRLSFISVCPTAIGQVFSSTTIRGLTVRFMSRPAATKDGEARYSLAWAVAVSLILSHTTRMIFLGKRGGF